MTLGQRIQELRKQKGLSQEGLGEALGVSRQAVSKWEGDNGIPELDTLIAMSRLFEVTVGQLLGVEEISRSETGSSDKIHEDRLEAILRRYAEEAASHRQEESWFTRWRMGVRSLGVIVACVLATVVVVLFVQNNSLRSTVRLLQSDVSNLRTQVSKSQNNLIGTIRNTIYDVLSEEAELLNQFGWEVVAFNLDHQTATIRLAATMKEYRAGSRLQFSANWRKTDESEGVTVSDWVEGPDFSAEMTLPLNYHMEISIRVEDTEGNIQEQTVETVYHLHQDSFRLQVYNLTTPFAITVKNFGTVSTTARAERAYVDILSNYPELFYPKNAVITAYVNSEEIFSEEMTVIRSEDSEDVFWASIQDYYYELSLKEGDALDILLVVTDNLGRTEQFAESGVIVDGRWERSHVATTTVSEEE